MISVLHITSMREVPDCILGCDDIHSIEYIIDKTAGRCCSKGNVLASNEGLDLQERLLDWVEVW